MEMTRRLFASWHGKLERAPWALPWWAAASDSLSIRQVLSMLDATSRSTASAWQTDRATYWTQAANAYLALTRRDTAEAIRALAALPDSMCILCPIAAQHLVLVQLLGARRRDREAASHLAGDVFWTLYGATEVLWRLERARVHDRLGNRDRAIEEYRFVAAAWRRADTPLQPFVREAREALARLGG